MTKRAMTLAMRVECDKESNGFGGKSNGNKCGGQFTAIRAMAMVKAMAWVMVMVTRLVGNKEGKGEGSKGNCNGDEGFGRQRGQWQQWQKQWQRRQGWWASNNKGDKEGDGDSDKGGRQATTAAMKRAMVLVMRVACSKEGNGDSGKSYGDKGDG